MRKAGYSRETQLLSEGFVKRTTADEPRLSELAEEYRRIGFDVEVIEHRPEPGSCSACSEQSTAASGDIYVRMTMFEGN